MIRREFITLLGGTAAAWPLAARAQQAERMRRIGVLMPAAADDPDAQDRIAVFLQGLQQLGWTDGRNMRIDIRWSTSDAGSRSQDTRRSLLRLRRTSSWPMAARPWGRCCGRPAPCRSCSPPSPIRSGRLCQQPGAAGRQCHRICPLRIRAERQMAGAAQRDCAARDASGRHSGCFRFRRHRPVRGNPVRGALVRGGIDPGRCARADRDRARRRGLCARSERRSDRDRRARWR